MTKNVILRRWLLTVLLSWMLLSTHLYQFRRGESAKGTGKTPIHQPGKRVEWSFLTMKADSISDTIEETLNRLSYVSEKIDGRRKKKDTVDGRTIAARKEKERHRSTVAAAVAAAQAQVITKMVTKSTETETSIQVNEKGTETENSSIKGVQPVKEKAPMEDKCVQTFDLEEMTALPETPSLSDKAVQALPPPCDIKKRTCSSVQVGPDDEGMLHILTPRVTTSDRIITSRIHLHQQDMVTSTVTSPQHSMQEADQPPAVSSTSTDSPNSRIEADTTEVLSPHVSQSSPGAGSHVAAADSAQKSPIHSSPTTSSHYIIGHTSPHQSDSIYMRSPISSHQTPSPNKSKFPASHQPESPMKHSKVPCYSSTHSPVKSPIYGRSESPLKSKSLGHMNIESPHKSKSAGHIHMESPSRSKSVCSSQSESPSRVSRTLWFTHQSELPNKHKVMGSKCSRSNSPVKSPLPSKADSPSKNKSPVISSSPVKLSSSTSMQLEFVSHTSTHSSPDSEKLIHHTPPRTHNNSIDQEIVKQSASPAFEKSSHISQSSEQLQPYTSPGSEKNIHQSRQDSGDQNSFREPSMHNSSFESDADAEDVIEIDSSDESVGAGKTPTKRVIEIDSSDEVDEAPGASEETDEPTPSSPSTSPTIQPGSKVIEICSTDTESPEPHPKGKTCKRSLDSVLRSEEIHSHIPPSKGHRVREGTGRAGIHKNRDHRILLATAASRRYVEIEAGAKSSSDTEAACSPPHASDHDSDSESGAQVSVIKHTPEKQSNTIPSTEDTDSSFNQEMTNKTSEIDESASAGETVHHTEEYEDTGCEDCADNRRQDTMNTKHHRHKKHKQKSSKKRPPSERSDILLSTKPAKDNHVRIRKHRDEEESSDRETSEGKKARNDEVVEPRSSVQEEEVIDPVMQTINAVIEATMRVSQEQAAKQAMRPKGKRGRRPKKKKVPTATLR